MSAFLRYALALLLAVPAQAVWSAEKPPLIFSGIDTDTVITLTSALVLQEAYSSIGERFVVRLYPSSRALIVTNAGLVDGALHRAEDIEKTFPNLLRVPVSHNQADVVALIKRPGIHIRNWQDLSPYRIGIVRGIVIFDKRTAGMDVTRLEHHEQLLSMLDRERLDVVVSDRLDLLAAMRNPAFKTLRIEEPALETIPLYHFLHKRHRALLPRLKAALEKMQSSGRIQAIQHEVADRLKRGDPLPPLPVAIERSNKYDQP